MQFAQGFLHIGAIHRDHGVGRTASSRLVPQTLPALEAADPDAILVAHLILAWGMVSLAGCWLRWRPGSRISLYGTSFAQMMQVALVLVVLGRGYSERKLRGEKHRANGYP